MKLLNPLIHARCVDRVTSNPNMLVPWFLMTSYAYYREDDPLVSDELYDWLGQSLKHYWPNINHVHKAVIDIDCINTGFYIDYPSIVPGAVLELRKEFAK